MPILGTGIAVIAAFSAALLVMFNVDPFRASRPEKALFFFSISIGILGIILLIGTIIFKKYFKNDNQN